MSLMAWELPHRILVFEIVGGDCVDAAEVVVVAAVVVLTAGMMSFVKYALAIFRAFVAAVVTAGSASAPPAKIFQTAVPCGTVVVAMLVVGV